MALRTLPSPTDLANTVLKLQADMKFLLGVINDEKTNMAELIKQKVLKVEKRCDEKIAAIEEKYATKLTDLETRYNELLRNTSANVIQTVTSQAEVRFVSIKKEIEGLSKDTTHLIENASMVDKETVELKTRVKNTEVSIKKNHTYADKLKERANNSEDHSRRSNLLFFKIPEETSFETPQECEEKVQTILKDVLQTKNNIKLDRVHRLGKRQRMKKQGSGRIAR